MFKDIIANDIDNVFLNLNEFADTATINGKQITVVIDSEARTFEGGREDLERSEGNILIFVKKSTWIETFKKLPKAFDAVKFNKIPCTIVRATERNDVLMLTLEYGS